MKDTTIAVDLAKNVFEIAVSDRPGRVVERVRANRSQLVRYLSERQPSVVLLEACGSAHHWARRLGQMGHRVVLLPPQYVRPYVRRNKTDRCDAKALLEAYRNEEIRAVPVKTTEQQHLAALHRMRSAWMGTRVARINAVRGMLREFGVVIPRGAEHVVPTVRALVEEGDGRVPEGVRRLVSEAATEIGVLEDRMGMVEEELKALAKESVTVGLLRTIPGIGLLTATALVAFVGEVRRFRSGRRFSSYLGLTPREHSTGGVRRLGRISKQGDVYVRMLLIHGARAVLRAAKLKARGDRLRAWALGVERLRGHNRATVALANKLARIAWAVWRRGEAFRSFPVVTPAAETTSLM